MASNTPFIWTFLLVATFHGEKMWAPTIKLISEIEDEEFNIWDFNLAGGSLVIE